MKNCSYLVKTDMGHRRNRCHIRAIPSQNFRSEDTIGEENISSDENYEEPGVLDEDTRPQVDNAEVVISGIGLKGQEVGG